MDNFENRNNKALINAIKEQLPNNINPVRFLMEVLHLERSAAYRRLRGEIYFTLGEVLLISEKLNLSLDLIMGKKDITKISPFRMYKMECGTPAEVDYEILEAHVTFLQSARKDLNSQFMLSANMLPQQIYLQYENLSKFFLFKWIYYNEGETVKAYHNIKVPNRMRQIFKNSFVAHQGFSETYYILDRYMYQYLINEIEYFFSIGLIKEEDKVILCEEMYETLDYLEKICITGKYDNGNNVQMYISNSYLDKTCYTIKASNNYIGIIETCIFNVVASTDKDNFDTIFNWIQARCRMSTHISQCGELHRIDFFNEQRQMLSSL